MKQQNEPVRGVPPEVPAQLAMNLELLDAADAIFDALADDVKAQIIAIPQKRAHEQFVASLAVLPPETRHRIRHCVTYLLGAVTQPREARLDDAAPPLHGPVPLRLVSCPGYAATA